MKRRPRIGTQVNIGCVEMAKAFLDENASKLTVEQNMLRLRFKAFIKKCQDALKKNKHLIGPDQRDYQRELERNFIRVNEEMEKLLLRPLEPVVNSHLEAVTLPPPLRCSRP